MLSYKRKNSKPVGRIQWPYKSESHCLPLGSNLSNYFHSILTRRPHQLLKVNTKRTELTHLSAKTPLFSHRYTLCLRQLLGISLLSANCLNLVGSAFLPQPSSCLLTLICLSQNLIFIPVTRVQMAAYCSSGCDRYSMSSAASSGLVLPGKELPALQLFHNGACKVHHQPPSIPVQAHPGYFSSVLKCHLFLSSASPVSCPSVCLWAAPWSAGHILGPCRPWPCLMLAPTSHSKPCSPDQSVLHTGKTG